MSGDSENPLLGRHPGELLAAFLDGELSADDRQRVQDWLATHPEEAALVQAHRNLLRVWREAAPPEPGEKAWREVLAQMEIPGAQRSARNTQADGIVRSSTLDSRSSRPSRTRWIRSGLLALAAAAAVLLAMFGPRKELPPPRPDGAQVAGDPLGRELTLMAPDDVDLVGMEMTDTRLLVVGDLPVQEPIELVAAGDVTFHKIDPDVAPMIIAPSGASQAKDSRSK